MTAQNIVPVPGAQTFLLGAGTLTGTGNGPLPTLDNGQTAVVGGDTSLVRFSVARAVPEPGTLALPGIALAGFGLSRRHTSR